MKNIRQSIAFGIEKIGVPCIMVRCNGEDLYFIIDTGSTENCLVEYVYEYFRQYHEDVIDDADDTMNITGVGGGCKCKKCSFKFSIGSEHFEETFSVLPNSDVYQRLSQKLGEPMCGLLGNKFLKKNNIVIDYGSQFVYTNKGEETVINSQDAA